MADPEAGDLGAAVAAGILTEGQAARLTALIADRRSGRARLPDEDEPFEIFSGFSEIFISVGLVMLFLGIGGVGLLLATAAAGAGVTPFLAVRAGVAAGAMLLAWLMAEHFTRRRRMSLPSIALATTFAWCAVRLTWSLAWFLVDVRRLVPWTPANMAIGAAGGLAAMLLYYRRFRLPFATFLIGLLGAALIFALAAMLEGGPLRQIVLGPRRPAELFFDFGTSPTMALATLVFGACAFVAAMRFDLRDPHRVSRHAAAAFWLHLLAAPALVNTVAFTLFRLGGVTGYLSTAAVLLVVAVLALVIDRRSFLTAGLVYLALLIGLALRSAGASWSPAITLLVLGAIVTGLGTWWTGIRAALMHALPGSAWKARLPPIPGVARS